MAHDHSEKTTQKDIDTETEDSFAQENDKKITILIIEMAGLANSVRHDGDTLFPSAPDTDFHVIISEVVHEYRGKVISEDIYSVIARYQYPEDALRSAMKLRQLFYADNELSSRADRVHVKMSIYFDQGIGKRNGTSGDSMDDDAAPAMPAENGQIHISHDVYDAVRHMHMVNFELMDLSERQNIPEGLIVYRVTWDKTLKPEPLISPLFLHHDAFARGPNPHCFYCGSKKHLVDKCPSKTLPEITDAIRRLGYKSLDEINKIFLKYSLLPNTFHEASGDELHDDAVLAHQAFYDLKRVFQLRLFRTLWNAEVKMWNNAKNRIHKGIRSGITWIAQDCIRVSDLQKAESLLEDAHNNDPEDYKVYCARGFLCIERGEFSKAEQFFMKALAFAKTDPEKIFLNFLLFRIYEVTKRFEKSFEKIREILNKDPYCAEARYIDILFQFSRGGENEPLQRLLRLIEDEREYYLYALIDPDVKPFQDIINPHLREMLSNVRDNAMRVLHETEEEMEKLKKIFGRNEDIVRKVDESWIMINKLANTESYFGFLDVVSHGLSIMKSIHRAIGEYKRELSESLLRYSHRIGSYMSFLEKYPNKEIAMSLLEKLEVLQLVARENWRRIGPSNTDELTAVFRNKEQLSQELEPIKKKITKLMTIQWAREFYSKFMKRNILFISIVFAAAFVVIPIIVFYVNLILLQLHSVPVLNVWLYQKMIIGIGSLCGVLLSFIVTLYDMPKKDFMVN